MYTHRFVAVVGQETVLNASGKYVRYVSVVAGQANPRIRLRSSNNDEIDLMPGQAITLDRRSTYFRLINVDGIGPISGSLLVGEGSMTDSRISGEVLNVDGSHVRSMALEAFSTADVVAAVAAAHSHIQLWNPAGSGKVLVLHTIRMSLEVAAVARLHIQSWNTALPTFVGAAFSMHAGTVPGGVYGQRRVTTNAAMIGQPLTLGTVSQEARPIELRDPIIIPQGMGVNVICGTVNLALAGSLDHYTITL